MLLGTTLKAMENKRFQSSTAFIHTDKCSRLTLDSLERLTLRKIKIKEVFMEENIKGNDAEAFIDACGDDFGN